MGGNPALLDAQSSSVLGLLNALQADARRHVIGGAVSDGGTTQATGADTHPNIDLDVAAIAGAVVNGTPVAGVAAATDVDADAGDQVTWGATSGKAAVGTVVLIPAGTYVIVFGAVAASGAAVPATEDEIDAFVGSANWAIVADVTFTRTADTTITVGTPSYSRRSATAAFSRALAETEADFRSIA